MLYVLAALWTVALILLVADVRSGTSRWLAAVAFFGGTGALAAVIDARIRPAMTDERLADLLYGIQAVSSVSSYYGVPYAFVLFALAFRPVPLFRPRVLRLFQLLLLLPIAYCLLFTPAYNTWQPITYELVVWWTVPYMLFGTAVILSARPRHAALSPTYWVVCLAVLPPIIAFTVLNYIFPSFGHFRMWVYNTWGVAIGFTVFVAGLFTYGFLGIRLLIDRRRLDSSLRAVTSGTAILNHAIKNDAGKIKLFGQKIKQYAESTGQADLAEDADIVLRAARHMQEMIQRVHQRTEDLTLRFGDVKLSQLVHGTIRPYETRLGGVKFQVAIDGEWSCWMDPAQVTEALNNVLSNALEAMNGEGLLTVSIKETKRELVLEVRDTGPGMDRRTIAKSLEPFYSTKGGANGNFGLGLPYAYHVMRKHGGTLLIRSKPGIGTSVYLTFPKRAVRAVQTAGHRLILDDSGKGAKANGRHPRMDRRG